MTHDLPPKWAENEEVLCSLKEVKLPPLRKPKVPSRINELTTTFSNTMDALPTKGNTRTEFKNHIQRLFGCCIQMVPHHQPKS